jgi:sensor c-di-GMP phosphodiesterase-like protein
MAYALFILIPVGILMLVSGYVADWQVRNRSQELSSDLTAHVNNTLDEAESLLLLLADRSQGRCTAESLRLMRSLVYDYAYYSCRRASSARGNCAAPPGAVTNRASPSTNSMPASFPAIGG